MTWPPPYFDMRSLPLSGKLAICVFFPRKRFSSNAFLLNSLENSLYIVCPVKVKIGNIVLGLSSISTSIKAKYHYLVHSFVAISRKRQNVWTMNPCIVVLFMLYMCIKKGFQKYFSGSWYLPLKHIFIKFYDSFSKTNKWITWNWVRSFIQLRLLRCSK